MLVMKNVFWPTLVSRSGYAKINTGRVNLNSLPFPYSLSTQIFPPCFSTNSLQSNKPKPVPVSFAVPVVVRTSDISNSLDKLSGFIPIPLSETAYW